MYGQKRSHSSEARGWHPGGLHPPMTADALVEVLRLVELALFSVLAVRSLQCWRGDRGEAAGWLAASFAVLAGVTLAGIVLPEHPTGPAGVWEMKAVVGVLLLFPYCLHRFTAAFRSGSHQSDRLFFLLTAFVIGWTLVLPGGPLAPDPAPVSFQAYVFAVLGEWTLVSFLAAGWLWRAGRGQPAVARLRMRTLSSASVMVNAAVLTL